MDEEKLIECVRNYEFLYNLQHPKYMDAVKKEIVWKEISEQLKQPGMFIKFIVYLNYMGIQSNWP